MKLLNLKTTLCALSLSFGASLLSAQSVTTDPVGYVTLSGDAGSYILTSPLLNSPVFSGSVTPVSTTVIQFSSNVPALPDDSFVQVTSGTLTGAVVDIDSVSGSSVTLVSPLPLDLDDTVVIRPHFLIEDLGESFSDGTSVTVYDSNGVATTASYRDNFLGTGWVGDSDVPIYPGEGFVLNTPAAFSVVISGAVSTQPVIFSANSGVTNLIGAINPIDNGGANDADADELFGSLPGSSSISVYTQGGSLTSPTIYSKAPDFLGGAWTPALSGIDFGTAFAIVVVPSADTAVTIPAVVVAE